MSAPFKTLRLEDIVNYEALGMDPKKVEAFEEFYSKKERKRYEKSKKLRELCQKGIAVFEYLATDTSNMVGGPILKRIQRIEVQLRGADPEFYNELKAEKESLIGIDEYIYAAMRAEKETLCGRIRELIKAKLKVKKEKKRRYS